MSRSRKKKPIHKWKDKSGKRAAAKAFRRYNGEIPVSAKQFFRRVYNSYDVWDNWWLYSQQDKDKDRFKYLMNELENNYIDRHLSEEEAYDMLDEMKSLSWTFQINKK